MRANSGEGALASPFNQALISDIQITTIHEKLTAIKKGKDALSNSNRRCVRNFLQP
jgi:hypothetical protein